MRLAFRLSYLVFLATGYASARLAAVFWDLTRASRRWGALVVPLQVPVLVVWCPARLVSLASFAVCDALALRLS